MKAKLFLAVFYTLASSWALIVLNYTSAFPAWQAWGMALLPAFFVGALGLRMYKSISLRSFIKACRSKVPRPVGGGNDPLAPCQTMYRQPYFDPRVN